MKRIFSTAVAISVPLALAACSVSTTPGGDSGERKKSDGSLTIGFSQATQQSPFYVQLHSGVEKAAKKAGAKLYFADAGGEVTQQNDDIQDLITRDVDVLLVNPVDPKGAKAGMAAAESAGVPVVTVDRPVPSGADAHVGRDNKKMGTLVGEMVAEQLGAKGGKIIEIKGDAGGAVARDRSQGFHKAVEGKPGIKIVAGPYCDYIRSKAVTAMQDLLQTNPDAKVVYAHNDDMALGALQVLKENGRTDVKVAGVDGLMEAVKAIDKGGPYVATALNDPISLGSTAVKTATDVARGKKVNGNVDAGTEPVDQGNAGEFTGSTTFAPASKP
ncbi:substrate-binding domain-containing protein [Streptomyces armeniacus]|nr:substrate-binding domain-containing protein [Streptomyces armeniacus]